MGADDVLVIVELVPDDKDVMHVACHVDDAVAAAEGLASLPDEFQCVGDLPVVVGVFVSKHGFGGRCQPVG